MYMFTTFQHRVEVELALSALEERNIKKENILVVPLDNRTTERRLFDKMYRSDGVSLIDIGIALSTAFSVIGASIGFRLTWGPIIWGLIGAVSGFLIGFLIDLMMNLNKRKKEVRSKKGNLPELIVIVYCYNEQADWIEEILWNNFALGMARMDNQ